MDRFYLPPDQWGEMPLLTGGEAHHCHRVMRKKAGDEVAVFDGRGREGIARIRSVTKNVTELEVVSVRESSEVKPFIEIAVGLPKGKTFDLILQKAVEMGVSRIQPLVSEQGNVRFKADEGMAKREKWQRTVLEACKQCGQNFLPEVMEPREVKSYVRNLNPGLLKIVGALTPETQPLRAALEAAGRPSEVVLLVGPEGDFSPSEYEEAFGSGFIPVGLGDLVLRTETAVFWMVAAVRYQFQS